MCTDKHYKEDLKKHVEKLFKKTQQVIVEKRGEVNRVKFKNFLSYFSYYQQENVDKRKGKHRERSWKDAMAHKPLNRGFRDKGKKTREPTIEQLEQMIEFFESELEKLNRPTALEVMYDCITKQQIESLERKFKIKWTPITKVIKINIPVKTWIWT